MKLTPYDKLAAEVSPPASTPYPDYYILNIGDLVGDFVNAWNDVIESESARSNVEETVPVFPEVYTIGEDGRIHKEVYIAQHASEHARLWHPDISLIINAVITAIKEKASHTEDLDVMMGSVWIDVAYMAEIQIQSNVAQQELAAALSNTRRRIAVISIEFGKQLYQRLIEYRLYKNGYFPYSYVGWNDDCAVVAFDEGSMQAAINEGALANTVVDDDLE